MELRRLGTSDIEIAPIVLGTWGIGGWWWGGSDDQQAVEALRRGLDLGANCIDTAPIYGFGHAEEIVGQAIADRRDEVIVATKCGMRWDLEEGQHFFNDDTKQAGKVSVYRNLTRDSIMTEVERSLERLDIEYIDLYQCHWPDETTDLEETMGALMELFEQDVIRAIGVSNFSREQHEKCMRYGHLHTSQPRFSLLMHDSLTEVLPFCHEHDISTLVYSPLEQGLLTGKIDPDTEFAEGDKRPQNNPWFKEDAMKQALEVIDETLRPVAEEHGATIAQVTIAATIALEGITAALLGCRQPKHVEENIGAAEVELSDEEIANIVDAFSHLKPQKGFG
jgi:methylglyoxal reductase